MPETYAKTALVADEVWTDTLEIDVLDGIPCRSVDASGLGGSANVTHIATFTATISPPLITPIWGEDSAETRAAAQAWIDLHSKNPTWIRYGWIWEKKVQAPGGPPPNADRELVVVGNWPSKTVPPLPMTYSWEGVTSISFSVVCTVTGLTQCEKVTDAAYDSRMSPLDPTDRTRESTWFADDDSTVTVTGGGLSASGALAGAGAEVNMGTAFKWLASVSNNTFPAANTTYGRHAGPTCFGEDASLAATLYHPGSGPEPDGTNYPGWCRAVPASGAYLILLNDGGIALQSSAISGTAHVGGCARTAPVTLNYVGLFYRRFDPDGAAPSGLKIVAEPRDWVDSAWVQHEWNAGEDYSQTQFPKSELFTYEYQFLSGSGIGQITQASRIAQGEDVGGTTIAQNDAQVSFLCQPLTAGVTGNPIWGPFLGITHVTSLNINDPPGAATRPSLWTGGEGVTVDPGDNDSWTVAAGQSSPVVLRSLTNRYELRMDWLANHPETEDYHSPDAPYILRRNRSGETYLTFGDNPDWWSTAAGGWDEEDVWNLGEFGYLLAGIVAPKDGTVTLKLTYKVPTVSDPCNTDFGCRYGSHGETRFEISYVERTATYNLNVVAGANSVQVDLCKPTEGIVPEGEHRLCVVKEIEWTLPTAGGTDEEWELSGLALVLDTLHTSNVSWHNKRAWDWTSCWEGFAGQADGKPALQVDPGYRRLREEWGLQYVQYMQHCALQDPPPERDPTYAKALSRIMTEVDLCEGWEATWLDPLTAAGNMDADQILFAPAMYWWDLQNQEQNSVMGAVAVGTYKWAYGTVHDLYYDVVFPRGEVSGLLYRGKSRLRETGAAWLYKSDAPDGTYSRVGSYVPDTQGLWRSDPMLEKDWYYGVAGKDLGATATAELLTNSGLEVANREYTFAGIVKAPVALKGTLGVMIQPGTMVPHFAYPNAYGDLMTNRIVTGISGIETPVLVDDSRVYVSAMGGHGGSVIYVFGQDEDGVVYLFTNEVGGTAGYWVAQGVVG